MVKLKPTGVKINTNLVWSSHNTGGVLNLTPEFLQCATYVCTCNGIKISTFVKQDWGMRLKLSSAPLNLARN